MGFPRQKYWSGLPFPSPGDLPHPRSNLSIQHWQADSLRLNLLGSPMYPLLSSNNGSVLQNTYICRIGIFTLQSRHRISITTKIFSIVLLQPYQYTFLPCLYSLESTNLFFISTILTSIFTNFLRLEIFERKAKLLNQQ